MSANISQIQVCIFKLYALPKTQTDLIVNDIKQGKAENVHIWEDGMREWTFCMENTQTINQLLFINRVMY